MESVLTKPYELTFEERPGYLYACITAPHITPAMATSYIAQIADRCAEIDCERLLIERNVPTPPPTHALAAVNDFVGMRAGRPVAIVNPYDGAVGETLKTQIEAGATLGARVAYFESIAAAEEWLAAEHD